MAVKELLELRVLLQRDDQEREQLQKEKAYLKAAIDQNESWVRKCYICILHVIYFDVCVASFWMNYKAIQ